MRIRDNLEFIRNRGLLVLLLFSVLECVFFFDWANVLGCGVSIYGWLLMNRFVLRRKNLQRFLLPTLAVTGYVIFYYFLPLIVTFIEFKPITFNFEVPYLTFSNNFVNVSVMVLAYCIAKHYYSEKNVLTTIWDKCGYFHPFTERQIWIIGFIGLFCWSYYATFFLKYNQSISEISEGGEGGFVSDFLKMVGGFAAFPMILLNSKLAGFKTKTSKKWIYLYLLFFLLATMASGRRGAMLFPIISYLMLLVLVAIKERRFLFSGKKAGIYLVLFLVLSGPVSDIAFAMALNRVENRNIFVGIWDTISDREKFNKLKSLALVAIDNSSGWNEYYVDNTILDRFCNLRVQDATLFYAKELGFADKGMKEFVNQYLLNEVPTFITRNLGAKKVLLNSPVDYMASRYFKEDWYSFGNRVSGDTGVGLFWLGYLYYPVALIIYSLFFYYLCSLVKNRSGIQYIPLPIKCLIMTFFSTFMNGQGILICIHTLVRGGYLGIFIFCFIAFIARTISGGRSIGLYRN